ncbi:MAG: hypothetical protein IJW73_04380 [Candidatus Gastranaerophilales bacterium]|nr:hypothetical protein [Candidatus Gastranaerophilales bacterium]
MINLVLILPIIFCVILLIAKNKILNNILITVYAIIHSFCSLSYFIAPETMGSNQYFSLTNTNIVFYLILSVVFLAVSIYNLGYTRNLTFTPQKMTRYSLMILIFIFSMSGGILSNNLGLTWIFIEGTTLASAYLIYFNKTKHSIEAAWKYVFICSIGIALAFVGIILLTIATGNVNSLDYQVLIKNAQEFNHFWLNVAFVFILFGFGTKMGLAPVHFWLPDAHAEAPSPISALLSATLLNCAFLVILNVYRVLIAANCTHFAKLMMLTMAILSLFVTSVFLYHTRNYKRMLAYSSIENMGILAFCVVIGGVAHYALFIHLIGHSLFKASYFLTSGNILELFETKRIKSIKALSQVDKKTAWLWIASFLGICAFPPSMLFISEFLLAKEMILQEHYVLCALFLMLLTIILYGMSRVVIKMAFGEKSKEGLEKARKNLSKLNLTMYIPQIILLTFGFVLGVYMPKFLNIIIKSSFLG